MTELRDASTTSTEPGPTSIADVEELVRGFPSVADVAVAEEHADRRVVAFVVSDGDLSLRALRAFVAGTVPPGSVPDEFVVLDRIPVLDDGQRDAAALSAAASDLARRHSAYLPPRTETEGYLAALWEELLGIEHIGAEDDFFALGGHSLLAVRIRQRVLRDLEVTVPPEALLSNSVLEDQANMIEQIRTGASAS